MQYPVNYIGITNGYHHGLALDFGWNSKYGGKNAPVYACADGKVVRIKTVADKDKGGNMIFIEHEKYGNIVSNYSHLSKINVKLGDSVKQGSQIGNMGNSGNATGYHLHFGLYANLKETIKDIKSSIDPFTYLEVYPNQTLSDQTKHQYSSKIKYYNSSETKKVKYVYNINDEGLNVRKTPNGPIVGSLSYGEKVTVLSSQNGWSKIGDNQVVYSKFLSDTFPLTYQVTASEGLNIRNKPSTQNSKILRTINKGTYIGGFATQNTWLKTSPTSNEWCSLNYLRRVEKPYN